MDLIKSDFFSNRRSSNCSFSTYSFSSNKEVLLEEGIDRKSTAVKFYTSVEPNTIRKFSPQIIISANAVKEIPRVKTKRSIKSTLNRADCIRKRIKTHFNQYLIKILNRKISSIFPLMSLCKLPQKFIADVKIESNKQYISLPVKEVFIKNFADSDSKSKLNNKNVIDTINSSENSELNDLLSKTYGDFFTEYLKSDNFSSDLKKFLKKEGENYSFLYRKYSLELVEYYKNGNPYKKKICFFSKKTS